jgi:hypothetical protein
MAAGNHPQNYTIGNNTQHAYSGYSNPNLASHSFYPHQPHPTGQPLHSSGVGLYASVPMANNATMIPTQVGGLFPAQQYPLHPYSQQPPLVSPVASLPATGAYVNSNYLNTLKQQQQPHQANTQQW